MARRLSTLWCAAALSLGAGVAHAQSDAQSDAPTLAEARTTAEAAAWHAVQELPAQYRNAYIEVELAFNEEQDLAKARRLLSESLEAAEAADDPEAKIWFQLLEIKIGVSENVYADNMIMLTETALDDCLSLPAPTGAPHLCEVAARYSHGLMLTVNEDPVSAMGEYSRAAAVATELNNEYWMTSVYSGLGFVMIGSGDPAAAVPFFKTAADLAVRSEAVAPIHLINLAVAYDAADMPEDVLEIVPQVREAMASEEGSFYGFEPVLEQILARAHIALENYDQAQNHIDRARTALEKAPRQGVWADLDLDQAQLDTRLGRHDAAIERLEAMLVAYPEDLVPADILSVQKLLGESYAAVGDFEKAYNSLRAAAAIPDSDVGVGNLLLTIKDDYQNLDAMARAHERTLAERDAVIAEAKVERAVTQRTVLAALVLAMAIFTFMLWRVAERSRRANRNLSSALAQRDMLFREVNHRVKNNLQIISSILSMQRRRSRADAAGETRPYRDDLRAVQARVQSMALIHQKLYRSERIDTLELSELVADLAELVVSLELQPVDLSLALDPLDVTMDEAVPVGLIVCELISNALKHGGTTLSDGDTLRIAVELKLGEVGWTLCVQDSGPGFAPEANSASTLGMTLVEDLASQLEASVTRSTSQLGGARVCVTSAQPMRRTDARTAEVRHELA